MQVLLFPPFDDSKILPILTFCLLFSEYVRGHRLTYQTAVLLNGIFTSVYEMSMRNNGIGVLNLSCKELFGRVIVA